MSTSFDNMDNPKPDQIDISKYAFVSLVDSKTLSENRFVILEDGTIYQNLKIKNLTQLKLEEQSNHFKYSYKELNEMVLNLLNRWRGENRKGTYSQAEDEIINALTLVVRGNTVLQMNSQNMTPSSRFVFNKLTHQYDLILDHDITYKCADSTPEQNWMIQEYYSLIENGDYLLYYLNEFRHIREIPIIIIVGAGGAGKSTILNSFIKYKPDGKVCVNYFGSDGFTGEFGRTSLIIEEETDNVKAPNLTLNILKNLKTSRIHNMRRMYSDSVTCRGFITLLFSANNNKKSKILSILNQKGDDVVSIKRRISTFFFDNTPGKFLNMIDEKSGLTYGNIMNEQLLTIDATGTGTSAMDRHLNYLESTGFFEHPKFKVRNFNALTIHSPHVKVCETLSDSTSLLLEELESAFTESQQDRYILQLDKDQFDFPYKLRSLENALWQMNGNKRPAISTVKSNIEAVAPNVFEIKKSNNNQTIYLKDRDLLNKIYRKHVGEDSLDDFVNQDISPVVEAEPIIENTPIVEPEPITENTTTDGNDWMDGIVC